MQIFLKVCVLGAASVLLSSATAPLDASQALIALDPTQRARSMCGGASARAKLSADLRLAALAAAPAGAQMAGIALYPDLSAPRGLAVTASVAAQRYFDQGLVLSYGFNHAGAVRSFRAAQRIDPECALCWWGEAIALGPNINAPMDDRDRPAALAALARAQALAREATALEQALIEAAGQRYSRDDKADRAALDAAYANAMLAVAKRFPDQHDVAVLAAEAAMDTTPWNYWEADKRTPVGRAGEAVRLVERVLDRSPSHPQANHLYIHLMENSHDPRRAEPAADRLASPLTPNAAHLVHMPGHIYQLLGRHRDSIRVNVAAARADERFIRNTGDTGLVRYGYYPHNIHFIVTSAQMAGDMKTALREAKRLRSVLDPATSARIGWVQVIDAAPFLAMAQFATPDAILAMPVADARLPYAVAMRHYARGVAYAQRRDASGFEREMAALLVAAKSPGAAQLAAQGVPVAGLMGVAENTARGRLAFAQGRYDEAINHYRAAIANESKLAYQEPPFWYHPVNQSLGAALLKAGKAGEAAQAFRTALLQTPSNGWALYGLAEAEAAQGNRLEAAAARRALKRAWIGNRAWLKLERL